MCAQTQVWSFEKHFFVKKSSLKLWKRTRKRTKRSSPKSATFGKSSDKNWFFFKNKSTAVQNFEFCINFWISICECLIKIYEMNRFRRKFHVIVHRQVGTKDEMVGRKENRFALIQRMQDNIHNLPRNVQQSWRKNSNIFCLHCEFREKKSNSNLKHWIQLKCCRNSLKFVFAPNLDFVSGYDKRDEILAEQESQRKQKIERRRLEREAEQKRLAIQRQEMMDKLKSELKKKLRKNAQMTNNRVKRLAFPPKST